MFLQTSRSRSPQAASSPRSVHADSHHKTLARFWVTVFAPRMMTPDRSLKNGNSEIKRPKIRQSSPELVPKIPIKDSQRALHQSPIRSRSIQPKETVLVSQKPRDKPEYPQSPRVVDRGVWPNQLTPVQTSCYQSQAALKFQWKSKFLELGNSTDLHRGSEVSPSQKHPQIHTPIARGFETKMHTTRESWENKIWKASTSKDGETPTANPEEAGRDECIAKR